MFYKTTVQILRVNDSRSENEFSVVPLQCLISNESAKECAGHGWTTSDGLLCLLGAGLTSLMSFSLVVKHLSDGLKKITPDLYLQRRLT